MARAGVVFPVSTGRDEMGRLTLAGQAISQLADQFGTPLYLYDGETVRQQAQRLTKLFGAHYKGAYELAYAAKAYFSLGFARKLAAAGLGVDVASLAELNIALRAGFRSSKIHLHGNNKSEAELTQAVGEALQAVVVDSLDELSWLEQLAQDRQRRVQIWLRITPGLEVDTHPFRQTAHAHSKFGLPIADGQAERAIRGAQESHWLHLTGLHMHLGSQLFEVEPYQRGLRALVELAESCGFMPRELSPGGGWGVPYAPEDPEGDPAAWVMGMCQTVREEYERRSWRLPKLVVEPGRFLAARAGVAVYTVGTIKRAADGSVVVAVDGGMADNPRPALYGAKYLAVDVDHPSAAMNQRVRIVGRACESGDELVAETWLPEVERGARLALPASGAYQLSMASNYNLVGRPAVVWLEPGQAELLQPREHPHEAGWWLGE
jgi:diaminopimelate decarboxylase